MMPSSENVKERADFIRDGHWYVYEHEGPQRLAFAIGVPAGQKRPALMLINKVTSMVTVLGRFDSAEKAGVVVSFMDYYSTDIQRAIDYWSNSQGNTDKETGDDNPG